MEVKETKGEVHSEEKTEVETKVETEVETEVNYKAELEKVKAEKEKLEEVARKQAGALREERRLRKQGEQSEEAPEDKVVSKVIDEIEKRRIADDIEATLEEMTPNQEERELIRHHYENSIKSTGSTRRAIKADLENAKLLANKSRFLSEAEKKVKKEMAERKAVEDAQGKVTPEPREEEDKKEFSPKEKAFLKRYGVKV